MKHLLLLFLLAGISWPLQGQNQKIEGTWIFVKANDKDNRDEPYLLMEFNSDGQMMLPEMGMETGRWSYNANKHAVLMTSESEKKFNGEAKIRTLNKKNMTLALNDAVLYFVKIDMAKTGEWNENSGLAGNWLVETDDGTISILTFELPDNFSHLKKSGGMTEKSGGSWFYIPGKKELIVTGFTHFMQGKSRVTGLSGVHLTLEHNGKTIVATKQQDMNHAIERLTFTEDGFPENDDNQIELPWSSLNKITGSLLDISTIVYRRGTLLPDVEYLEYTTFITRVKSDPENSSVDFINFFVEEGDTVQYSEKVKDEYSEAYNYYFPEEEPWPVRLVGEQDVTVPAGTFRCLVIEGFDGEDKVKYWMIIDRPGIYARIIRENTDKFGDLRYSVIELMEVK